MNYDYEDENLKVKIVLKNKGNLIANANVVFKTIDYGWVTVKNFQIWKSKIHNDRLGEPINIVPTSVMRYRQVFLESEDKWHTLELKIFRAFIRVKENEIDIDEVDRALSVQ